MATIRISELRTSSGGVGGSEISLTGDPMVFAGTTNTYTITDFDDFSVYTATAENATVTRVKDVVTVVVDASATGIVNLKLSRNGVERSFLIGIGSNGVATPRIIYPSPGAIDVPAVFTVQSSPFTAIPAGSTTHMSSKFQFSPDASFSTIAKEVVVTTGNKTQLLVSDLSLDTEYYVRVMYTDSDGVESAFSQPNFFKTTSKSIDKPVVTIPSGTINVKFPIFNVSAFVAKPVGSDTLVSTSWVLRDSNGTVVWEVLQDSVNKSRISPPEGVLETSKSYTISAQLNGAFSSSPYSDPLPFTTAASFTPTPGVDIGVPFGGGYYVGCNVKVDGVEYALIVSPKTQGGESTNAMQMWSAGGGGNWNVGASLIDGAQNTTQLFNHVSHGESSQAAIFVKGLNINGYSDWYIPSIGELNAAYEFLKPDNQANSAVSLGSEVQTAFSPPLQARTQTYPAKTSSPIFQIGGEESFDSTSYSSSTSRKQGSASSYLSNNVAFSNGANLLAIWNNYAGKIRAFRRVRITP